MNRHAIFRSLAGGTLLVCLLFTAAESTAPQTCVAPPPGLVGWWSGDVDARDIQDGFDGTFANGAVAGVPGYVSGAFDFTAGDTDYVEIPAGVAQLTRGDITMEAWINSVGSRPQIGATLYAIFMRGTDANGGGRGADLVRHTNDHVSFRIVTSNTGFDVQSQQAIDLGVWHHVVGVRRGGTIEIWLDGVMNSRSAPTGLLRGTGTSYLGQDNFRLVNTDFDGLIDEVSIYDRALNASEIQTIFNAGTAGKCNSPAQQLLFKLIEAVMGLNINQGISNSFDSKLNAAFLALDDINQNNDLSAINALQAFIYAVEAQRGNQILDADATDLITAAQEIIDLLIG